MDFKGQIKALSERTNRFKNKLQTEEATKTALIMPFIQALGYDIFNPDEVIPELDCDLTKKKGEKIDYAIVKDGEVAIIVECKHIAEDLDDHKGQLSRYFAASKARFGLLTNGQEYRFYTDLVKPNLMDEDPFLSFDIEKIKDAQIKALERFTKENFDVDTMMSSANEMKFMHGLNNAVKEIFEDPSPEFIRFMTRSVYDGKITESVLTQFTELVKKDVGGYITDRISERINAVVKSGEDEQKRIDNGGADTASEDESEETNQNELDGYYIVKNILREVIAVERIGFRDGKSYSSVVVDGSSRKPVCRFYFNNESNLRIEVPSKDAKAERGVLKLESLDDIYKYASLLQETAKQFI